VISILVVDDNPLDRRLAIRELSKAMPGSHIVEASNAQQVTEALEAGNIELIVTDYQLRWSTGLEVLRDAKRQLPDVPVIMFTNTGTEEVAVQGMKIGLDDYVLKAPGQYAALAQSAVGVLRKRQEQEESRRQEEARSRAKDDFLMMMAHELRGPLAPMRTALFLLQNNAEDPEVRVQALQALERQVNHMAELVNDLLDVSRIISGRLRLSGDNLDLGRLLTEVVEDRRKEFDKAGVRLEFNAGTDTCRVLGDRTRLVQVFGNLLDNALKFTPSGESVSVRVESFADQNVRIVVQDTGIGIDADILPRLFEPFVQADRSLARSAGGLGMGLAVVKRLVELHGGKVEVHSAGPGQGATFDVWLPRTQLVPTASSNLATLDPQRNSNRRVLIIEDYRDTAQMMSLLLQSHGYIVSAASTGEEGLRLARETPPDVVLCDLGLPDLPGFEVARQLRQDAATASIPVIAISGYGQEHDRARALESGFSEHMSKPVQPENLLARLQQLWEPTSTTP
jgi:signal transduction histidine kinase